jgi:hypothetical protein
LIIFIRNQNTGDMKLSRAAVFSLLIFLYIITTISCTFDNQEDLLEDFECDTIGIVYDDLTYIFTGICANCHNESLNYKGIKMNSYQNVKTSVNTGRVWRAINHEDGIRPMPDGLPKLLECDLNKIGAWINAGMPEN